MKKLILKYLTDTISDVEKEQLLDWIQKPTHQKTFQELVKENYDIDMVYNDVNEEQALLKVKKAIQMKEKPVRRLYWRYAAAAVLIIALASTYFLRDTIFNSNSETITPIIVNNQIEPGVDKATLTLETGETVALVKGTSVQTQNATSNGEEIVYIENREKRKENRDKLVYNTLTIPRGGQFQLTLSDGTRVWLNSETQLKYPVSFTDGESRQVELVYGEAYFDVSPSTEHKGSDFKVYHSQQEVQVLGTQFNIKAYKDETNIFTTLVEGKVVVNHQGKTQSLNPGLQSDLNSVTNMLSVLAVNVYNEVSWKEGVFSFHRKSLKDIMIVLSRWYDMDVTFVDLDLGNVGFNGVLTKDQKIEDILDTIKSFGVIKTYEINDKKVILK
ncbi:MAG TPA: FecR domain-containing protein [Flavobacteriaceae bacterium]